MSDDDVSSVSSSEASDQYDDEPVVDAGLENPDVVTKYNCAADIAKSTMRALITAASKPGQSVVKLCQLGDALIARDVGKVYNKPVVVKNDKGESVKKPVSKGIGFPTSIAINHCVGHYSPMPDSDATVEEGDVVKM